MKLDELKPGQSGRIIEVAGEGALRQHLLDMGMIPGAEVTLVQFAPMGDPLELRMHGYELTLRRKDAGKIQIDRIGETSPKKAAKSARYEESDESESASPDRKKQKSEKTDWEKPVSHPGLGEEGKFHPKGSGHALSPETILTFALVGNQNSGKTTLFNQLTGSNQHVGNFPGVTVDRKDGVIRGYEKTRITDLPGIYSMSPYSGEELVSRDFVLKEHPHAIINIVDVTTIDRSLYLTMQLLEMGIPTVVALNMMDEMTGNGGSVNVNALEEMLGVPVVPISAAKNEGIEELIHHAIHIARYQEKPLRQDFCDSKDHGGAVHRCIHAVIHLIEDHAEREDLPVRFAAAKLIEGDERVTKQLKLDRNEEEMLEHMVLQMETERGLDRCAAMAEMRYAYSHRVCDRCVKRPGKSREHIRSRKMDRVLTGKYTAIPLFILIMGIVFLLTFGVIGPFFQNLLERGITGLGNLLGDAMVDANVNIVIQKLILDGLFSGVGSVLSFLPIIVIMFFFLSVLEDSGYIARVAFVMDHLLRKIGLSGSSIVPLLIGFGCTVPAVMSTRTLPSARDRKMTILLTPFMSCTAKLPIYGFFIQAFFPQSSWLIITGLYFLSIAIGVVVSLIYKKTLFRGKQAPFVMELPNYRLPRLKNVGQLLWEKAKDFLQRAFTVILVATIVVWVLQNFDFTLNMVDNPQDSILASIAGLLSPVMKPTGLGDWRIVTSLVSGFMAKESVVASMKVLFPGGELAAIGSLTAASALVFSLLYTPCVAAVTAVRRELGRRWALYVILWQCMIAWLAATVVQLIGDIIN